MLLLKNGLIHSMTQEAFLGDILIDNGKIKAVGVNLSANGAQEIELAGKFVLPGLIDAHCHIGMWEDGMGEEGSDGNEMTDHAGAPRCRRSQPLRPLLSGSA